MWKKLRATVFPKVSYVVNSIYHLVFKFKTFKLFEIPPIPLIWEKKFSTQSWFKRAVSTNFQPSCFRSSNKAIMDFTAHTIPIWNASVTFSPQNTYSPPSLSFSSKLPVDPPKVELKIWIMKNQQKICKKKHWKFNSENTSTMPRALLSLVFSVTRRELHTSNHYEIVKIMIHSVKSTKLPFGDPTLLGKWLFF